MPPNTPMMSATITRSGSISRPAIRRGQTRYLNGSVEGRERVDLLGHAHGADLRGHRGADPAGDHQPGQHRTEPRVIDSTTMVATALGLEAREAGIALQREHHAGEDRGQPTTGSE